MRSGASRCVPQFEGFFLNGFVLRLWLFFGQATRGSYPDESSKDVVDASGTTVASSLGASERKVVCLAQF